MGNNTFKKFLLSVILLSSLILSGCMRDLSLIAKSEPISLVPRDVNYGYFNFVVPDNFVFIPEKSFVFDYDDDVRAYIVYGGKASVTQLVNFFNDYMPEKGWEVDLNFVSTDGIIVFRRDERLIVIKIIPDVAGVSYLKILLTK